MWGKVNNWLHDFDKKTNLLINEINVPIPNYDFGEYKNTNDKMLITEEDSTYRKQNNNNNMISHRIDTD